MDFSAARIEEKVITTTVFVYEDFRCSLNEILEVVESLTETQYGFQELLINSVELAKWLESNDIAIRSTKGTYSKGRNCDAFFERLCCVAGY